MATNVKNKLPLSVPVRDVPNLDTGQKIMAFIMRERQLVCIVNSLALALGQSAGLRRKLAIVRSEYDVVKEAIDHVRKDMADIKPQFTDWSPGQIIMDLFQDASILEIAMWSNKQLRRKPEPILDTLAMAFKGEGDYA